MYLTDRLLFSRSVTMAQCTRSFVKGETYSFPQAETQAKPKATVA